MTTVSSSPNNVADRSHQGWIPSFFVDFEKKICAANNTSIAQKHNVKLVRNQSGSMAVDGLTKAASKWRIANAAKGLEAMIMHKKSVRPDPKIPEDQISQELCDSYSAQLVISLSVFAFEKYAKCFSRDWNQHKPKVFVSSDANLAKNLRTIRDANAVKAQIINFLDRPGQIQRIRDFYENGRDEYLYDVCHFIRHGYAHGALRGYEGLIVIAPDLKNFVLEGIKSHTKLILNECG